MDSNKRYDDVQDGFHFEQILEKELIYFKKIKKNQGNSEPDSVPESDNEAHDIVNRASRARLTGLAFSGGGIRSATFNLGVLQALAKLKLLDQFHYLSTVSGGGYIGSWLSAWIQREATSSTSSNEPLSKADNNNSTTNQKNKKSIDASSSSNAMGTVSSRLAASISAREDKSKRAAIQPDPGPIRHLREYSNYLTPRLGLWSTDTWTLGVTYIRNLILTFSLLFGTLVTLVLCTRMITMGLHTIANSTNPVVGHVYFCVFLFLTSLFSGFELSKIIIDKNKSWRCNYIDENIAFFIAVLGYLAATTGGLWLWNYLYINPQGSDRTLEYLIVIFPLVGFLLGFKIDLRSNKKNTDKQKISFKKHLKLWAGIIIGSLISALVLMILITVFRDMILKLLPAELGDLQNLTYAWYVVLSAPIFIIMFSIVAVVFVGLSGSSLNELGREWIGRFIALLAKISVLITFVLALVVFSSHFIEQLFKSMPEFSALLGVLWGVVSIAGSVFSHNLITGNTTLRRLLIKAIITIAPLIFIVGMLMLTIWITDHMVVHFSNPGSFSLEADGYLLLMYKIDPYLLLMMLVTSVAFMFIWSNRVGVNRFSLHSLYAARLIRAYLGASNINRTEHPFIGFDEKDNNVHMSDLISSGCEKSGPYLIINSSINLVSSRRLAWQKRKAASFTFTPLFCGYEFYCENNKNKSRKNEDPTKKYMRPECYAGRIGGYVKSKYYASERGGISLGKAMTISGAAASPNMGYHSSPAITFLMTVFNLRLGWWLPNTKMRRRFNFDQSDNSKQKSRRRAIKNRVKSLVLDKGEPGIGLLYLLKELLGKTNENSNHVYLSDGGHFENLGIFELVRRRCRIIVACDAEADPDLNFTGLGNAIEKCQTDLGVPIDIDVSQIQLDNTSAKSSWHCAVGCIKYSEADTGQSDGTLLYIKASMTGDEPQNVLTYASENPDFPHQTTADQWFDETQFESYRTLGEHIITATLSNAVDFTNSSFNDNESRLMSVIREARKQWYPGTDHKSIVPVDHDAMLEGILDSLRTDSDLEFLDAQLYPNLQKINDKHFFKIQSYILKSHDSSLPSNYKEFRAGFYFCKHLIQFMQQVYYDRKLDLEYSAPKNRGWMNLFRRWSWSQMLAFTWTMTAGTYGARFQSFCEHRLSLDSGEPRFSENYLTVKISTSMEDENSDSAGSRKAGQFNIITYDEKQAKIEFSLHNYENYLIKEFIEAYKSTYIDIKETTDIDNKEYEFHVFPMLVKTDDPISDDIDMEIDINSGFVITGPDFVQSENNLKQQAKAIHNVAEDGATHKQAMLYLRVRPSMRNMDMSRKAFANLTKFKHQYLSGLLPFKPISDLKPGNKEYFKTFERRAYRDIFSMEQENIDHCNWCTQIAVDSMETSDNEQKE